MPYLLIAQVNLQFYVSVEINPQAKRHIIYNYDRPTGMTTEKAAFKLTHETRDKV